MHVKLKIPPEEYELIVTKTARSSGAVGAKALVPRYVAETSKRDEDILDFGAGPKAIHKKMLEDKGFLHVTAYDIGKNFNPEIHDPDALSKQYDTVYASNVLNVQPSREYLEKVIETLAKVTKPSGRLVVNYPVSPRKSDVTVDELVSILKKYFTEVKRVAGTKQAPVLEAKGKIKDMQTQKETPKNPIQAIILKKGAGNA